MNFGVILDLGKLHLEMKKKTNP